MRIHVEYDVCEGNGLCAAIAPAHFSLDRGGLLSVRDAEVGDDDAAAVELAVATCPVEALRLER